MDGDFRTAFVRAPGVLRHHPALVLNADYRPLSYYPLSLWPWQEAIKAAYLERVDIVAEYDAVVHSPSITINIPSVVVLKDYVKPQKRVAFTRFNLFLRDEFCCQYCGANGELTFDHVVPRVRGGIPVGQTWWLPVQVAICTKVRAVCARPDFICAKRRASRGPKNCAIWAENFRPTICTKPGSISFIGTQSWTLRPPDLIAATFQTDRADRPGRPACRGPDKTQFPLSFRAHNGAPKNPQSQNQRCQTA